MEEIQIRELKEKAKNTVKKKTRELMDFDKEINAAFYRGLILGFLSGSIIAYLLFAEEEKSIRARMKDDIKYTLLDSLL